MTRLGSGGPPHTPPPRLPPSRLMLQLQPPGLSALRARQQALSHLQSLSRCRSPARTALPRGLALPARVSVSIASLSITCHNQFSIMAPGPLCS